MTEFIWIIAFILDFKKIFLKYKIKTEYFLQENIT